MSCYFRVSPTTDRSSPSSPRPWARVVTNRYKACDCCVLSETHEQTQMAQLGWTLPGSHTAADL